MSKYIKPALEYVALRSEERIASGSEYCYYMASPNTQDLCDPTFHPHWDGPGPIGD